ncbi:malonyl-CoA decarboxylase [Melaminivora jejuensis]|uniref:malonyl-CoA decarboxylase n=1 Tax=Melaminivora jejuensis TaxID=1267217 RepID=UPI001AE04D89|nr:malonyl-CoA decarboxylase [Melaminivora jejuensis]UHJ66071.1 malonyl-CoA decarboxylase [Melaminivora jejuensis]
MNSPASWIARKVGRKAAAPQPDATQPDATQPDATQPDATQPPVQPPVQPGSQAGTGAEPAAKPKARRDAAVVSRSTHERLKATLRREDEALTPRALRRLLTDLQEVAAPRVSEIEAGRRAQAVAEWYADATPEERRDLWLLLCEHFAADAAQVTSAQQRYADAAGTDEAPQAEAHLRRALVAPRTRLLQRFAVFPEGLRFLVDLRAELLPRLKAERRLLPLDAELEQLFSTWFDVAFLELRRLSWDSPASLLEKLIKYEAVHDIKSWADLKNRVGEHRRCYGFFHPRLQGEPLIFVEVALVDAISDSITPLLDETAAPADLKRATTAIFYSISNTQTGLRGVSFGDSLIKHVVETLTEEFPRLRTFATLSPIPGFRAWLTKNGATVLAELGDKERAELARALQLPAKSAPELAQVLAAAAEQGLELPAKSPLRRLLKRSAARYLGQELKDGRPVDPVARFHLGNGARVERLNWAGDPSAKGIKQSFGLMVNYLYDLKRLDKHREQLAKGRIAVSSEIESLLSA